MVGGSGTSRAYIIYMQTAVQQNMFRCTAVVIVYRYVCLNKITPPTTEFAAIAGCHTGCVCLRQVFIIKLFIRSAPFSWVYALWERFAIS